MAFERSTNKSCLHVAFQFLFSLLWTLNTSEPWPNIAILSQIIPSGVTAFPGTIQAVSSGEEHCCFFPTYKVPNIVVVKLNPVSIIKKKKELNYTFIPKSLVATSLSLHEASLQEGELGRTYRQKSLRGGIL